MMRPHFINDPFNRLPPPTREGKVAELIDLAADLARDERPAVRRHAHALRRFLAGEAATLEQALGIATPRGSRATPQALAAKVRMGLITDDVGPPLGFRKLDASEPEPNEESPPP